MGHAGKGVGAAHGHSNTPATAFGRAIGLIAKGLGHGNGPAATVHGRGPGSHAGLGNRGHNSLAGRSSHSQNNSHKGETHDGRSFSNHAHAEHSLAQDAVAHITKADQAVQADDNDPGKAKGFLDSPPPSQEVQTDHSVTLNLNPVHANLDEAVVLGLQSKQEPNPDHSRTLNLETLQLGPKDFATSELQAGQEPQAVSGWNLNTDMIHFATLRLQPDQELQADAGWKLNFSTMGSELDTSTKGLPYALRLNLAKLDAKFLETDVTSARTFPHRDALEDIRAETRPPTTTPELDDDDATGWKLAPFYGLVLVFLLSLVFSRQGIPRALPRDASR
jgi:hypothetical protein